MHLKSYFATTVESAMALAARELGEEAMLVYSRPASPEVQYLGKHEVVFALPELKAPATCTPGNPASETMQPIQSLPMIEGQLSSLNHLIQELTELVRVVDCRLNDELCPGRQQDNLNQAPAKVSEGSEVKDAKSNGSARCLEILDFKFSTKVPTGILIVGSPGTGKSATALKLAAKLKLDLGIHPHLAVTGQARIDSSDCLRIGADLLGLPFSELRSAEELCALVDSGGQSGPVIIDTPSIGHDCGETILQALAMADCATRRLTTLQIWPATWTAPALRRARASYAQFHPDGIALTLLDQADDLTAAWEAMEDSGLPVALLSEGTRIPDDLHLASAQRLEELLSRRVHQADSGRDGDAALRIPSRRVAVAA